MVLVILLVLALFVLQTLLPGRFRARPGGISRDLTESLGPRDEQPPFTRVGERTARALGNMQEALPVFLALALLNLIVGTAGDVALTGAWIFLIARVVYLPLYMAGVPVVRTLAWVASWVGLGMLVAPLLGRI
jgi:uncharacterized MAPEG superfamily protein